ncbi:DUF4383 domain-containing protein [Candidatus Protochlamydia phocaeensis]|uniref:DUF4383 domain-containing protein n=1 Tax=Candidatus Protochlamydia phocaeensis TaxID=1414722 RepID=UPI0008385638|nr:DUF4383 domain-containing protein [Candidatus Protochlamydia phocaeensis]
MLKTCAIVFGVIMLIIGLLGFVPQVNPNGMLLGLFHVNLLHNLIHLATGLAALLCGLTSEYASRIFFQIFGIVYGLVALLGYYYLDHPIFGILANNLADAILHTLIAAFSLYLGFGYHSLPRSTPPHDREHHLS